jgi:hypothetical protein
VHDVTVALSLFGFLGSAPSELVGERRRAFLGLSHDYNVQRDLVDRVPETSLLLAPADVAPASVGDRWRQWLGESPDERGTTAPAD